VLCLPDVDLLEGRSGGGVPGYGFVLRPDRGAFAIVSGTGDPLATGSITSSGVAHVEATCMPGAQAGSTLVTMSVNGGEPITYEDPSGLGPFDGIGLATFAGQATAVASFDNLQVTKT
jgi:hypothetical protein